MRSNVGLDPAPIFCDRCTAELLPGAGQFFVVKIEAVADPTPARLPEEPVLDASGEIDRLLRSMAEQSAQELLDQVYRRVTLYLCNRCFRAWIENPTGS